MFWVDFDKIWNDFGLILATYPVAEPRHHSKPKSKLTSPDVDLFWTDVWPMLVKCSEQAGAKHVPNVPPVPHVPNVPNTNIVPGQHSPDPKM